MSECLRSGHFDSVAGPSFIMFYDGIEFAETRVRRALQGGNSDF